MKKGQEVADKLESTPLPLDEFNAIDPALGEAAVHLAEQLQEIKAGSNQRSLRGAARLTSASKKTPYAAVFTGAAPESFDLTVDDFLISRRPVENALIQIIADKRHQVFGRRGLDISQAETTAPYDWTMGALGSLAVRHYIASELVLVVTFGGSISLGRKTKFLSNQIAPVAGRQLPALPKDFIDDSYAIYGSPGALKQAASYWNRGFLALAELFKGDRSAWPVGIYRQLILPTSNGIKPIRSQTESVGQRAPRLIEDNDSLLPYSRIKERPEVVELYEVLVRGSSVTLADGAVVNVQMLPKDVAKSVTQLLVSAKGELDSTLEAVAERMEELSAPHGSRAHVFDQAAVYLVEQIETLRQVASGGVNSSQRSWLSLLAGDSSPAAHN